jgi:hypothetical protein
MNQMNQIACLITQMLHAQLECINKNSGIPLQTLKKYADPMYVQEQEQEQEEQEQEIAVEVVLDENGEPVVVVGVEGGVAPSKKARAMHATEQKFPSTITFPDVPDHDVNGPKVVVSSPVPILKSKPAKPKAVKQIVAPLENGEPVEGGVAPSKKVRAPAKPKEVVLDENGEPVAPVKKARAPAKPKEVVLDENGEPVAPVKKARAPAKPKEVVLDENGEPVAPVKKARAPAKPKVAKAAADGVEGGVAPSENGEPVVPSKKPRAPAKPKAVKEVVVPSAKPKAVKEVVVGVEGSHIPITSNGQPVVVRVEGGVAPSVVVRVEGGDDSEDETATVIMDSSDDEEEILDVVRIVIDGFEFLVEERTNRAYLESNQSYVGTYNPKTNSLELLHHQSEEDDYDEDRDECPNLSDDDDHQ